MGKKGTMPVDVRRVIRAAVDAALEDPAPPPRRKRRLPGGRVLLLGAGLMTAGKLAGSSRGREMFGTVKDRMEDVQDKFLGPDDDLPEDGGALDEQEALDAEEEEPQAEAIEGEELGDSSEDDELDEDEPEPELEEPARPRRTVRSRRSRADVATPARHDRKRSRAGGSRRQAVE